MAGGAVSSKFSLGGGRGEEKAPPLDLQAKAASLWTRSPQTHCKIEDRGKEGGVGRQNSPGLGAEHERAIIKKSHLGT